MENQHITIRSYDAATDLANLSAIWLDASLMAHPFIGKPRLMEQQKLIEGEYLPNSETWVACHGDRSVGFISLLGDFVGGIFIAPDWQGRGIGRRLIDHALRQKGALSLEVYTRNEQAMRFYSALGFREVSRRAVDDLGYPYENARLHLKA
ncbi:GNAT family N-acetyltransferase [Ponticoccus alexandrii]|uniref:GNAT family N-acetyltransferase n=1 Tax=Ponticoccus alexandrii TaxID=1943633 RepID=A0ABX7FEN2_9RHOB|nr:GNAT family N-acetyltransferase [Ponticoccus alexandrii]ETA49910.1 acetyltransferase [Rhodobacteraceae bacterium PD-2]QRF68833.1 GNAT family N-acetyltransferase [Ponticoccus alexandrii]